MTLQINEKECIKAGIDVKEVTRIASGLSRYGRQAEKLGIIIFGGSSGSLRFHDNNDLEPHDLVLAFLDGIYDGGDGGCDEDDEGFLRGE